MAMNKLKILFFPLGVATILLVAKNLDAQDVVIANRLQPKKIKMDDSCKDDFLAFSEALEYFINADFLDENFFEVRVLGALSDLTIAEAMLFWPNLSSEQRRSLRRLVSAFREYENSVYDPKTENQKLHHLKSYTQEVYDSFSKVLLSEIEKEEIRKKRLTRGIEILKGINYPGIELLESQIVRRVFGLWHVRLLR